MNTAWAIAVAVDFVWLGMVLAISFLEAPLKFQAPEVTVRIGLGIGRRVFRALNAVEAVFSVVLLIAVFLHTPSVRVIVAVVAAVVTLLLQLAMVRPRLNRRTEAVLAGQNAPRSHGHFAYIALESGKVVALIASGILLLAA